MKSLQENPDPYLAATAEMLVVDGKTEAANILRTASVHVEETGHDGWNGNTTYWTIYLMIQPGSYSLLGNSVMELGQQIDSRLSSTLELFPSDRYSVKIIPKVENRPEWRHRIDDVALETRKNIIDWLKSNTVSWSGRIEEVEFLERLYDLELLPSNDKRHNNAARDIWEHRVNNPTDWPDDWIYSDKRFNLLHGTTDNFLRFLCEMVHPLVRPNRDDARMMIRQFNDRLRQDGWMLVAEQQIAGHPRFVAQKTQRLGGRSVSRARTVADALEAGWMQKQIERLENSIDHDPALAIGEAKDLVETCCKTILRKRNVSYSSRSDLPELTKTLVKELKLVPEGIPSEAKGADSIKRILRNLSALTQYLAELRSLYGSGHGKDGEHRGLEARHARLAVGAAVTFIDFITETYYQREKAQQSNISTT